MASSLQELLSPPQTFDFGLPTATSTTNARNSPPMSGQRLQTIDEMGTNAPPIPPKSVLRDSISQAPLQPQLPASLKTPSLSGSPRGSSGTTKTSVDTNVSALTAPPAYSWMPDIIESEDGREPVEGEKLAALRSSDRNKKKNQRGGWLRLALIIAAVIIIVGLAVGLAIGLTVGNRQNTTGAQQLSPGNSSSSGSSAAKPFPLGTYSLVTALEVQSTDCTSNSATWTCPPYHVYNPSDASSSSQAIFNWIISATSQEYATINTGPTSQEGIPANLTISSPDGLTSIPFANQSLTYISPLSNSTWGARYTFNLTMPKYTVPAVNLTSNNAQTKCFFNQTVFAGILYLATARTYPSGNLSASTGFPQWPYAVEVRQSSAGGANIPACYEFDNGVLGSSVVQGSTPQTESSQCLCGYRNF